jgi:hypothetical protein
MDGFPKPCQGLMPHLLPDESASSRTLVWDAMDADGVARRATPTRTAKSCGPVPPTLGSSLQVVTCRRRWQKSPVTGEHVISRKPSRRECRSVFGEPVVIMLVCFHHFAREAMGAASTRHSLRPLSSRAVRSNSSGAICAAGMQAHV